MGNNNNANSIFDNGPNENKLSNPNDFTLFFKYKEKEIYLDITEEMPFKEVRPMLINTYELFQTIQIKGFLFNEQKIDENKNCKDLHIPSDSTIIIDAD